MVKFDLEIDGKISSTTKGNVDKYYGGGEEAWDSLASAKAGVPSALRIGRTVGVVESNKIVEYIWHPDDITDNGLVLKTAGTAFEEPTSDGNWVRKKLGAAYSWVAETITNAITVENDLNSTSATNALSANQGRVLKLEQDLNSSHRQNSNNPHGTNKTDVGLGNVDNTNDQSKIVSVPQQAALDLKADLNGNASENFKVADATVSNEAVSKGQLDSAISALQGSLIPQGNWDASANTPDISGTTDTGKYWIVSVDGSINIGGITDWKNTDWVVKTATGWAKVDNTDKVVSVAGKTGVVTLDIADITGLQTALDAKQDTFTVLKPTLVAVGTTHHTLTLDAAMTKEVETLVVLELLPNDDNKTIIDFPIFTEDKFIGFKFVTTGENINHTVIFQSNVDRNFYNLILDSIDVETTGITLYGAVTGFTKRHHEISLFVYDTATDNEIEVKYKSLNSRNPI